jgi:alkylation response protein AidB-like acyl-CoA dehydrogenase
MSFRAATPDAAELAKDLARKFSCRASAADKLGELPKEDIGDLKTSGYLGLSIPKDYGGWGLSLAEVVAAHLELSKGSGSTALVVTMTLNVMGHAGETRAWSAEHYEKLCREVAKGALINAVASEPRLGSPSRGGLPDTFAVRGGNKLVINGHKTWTTGGAHLDHLLVRLRLDDEAVTVWIPATTPGLRWEKTWGDALSLRASDSHDLFLENVVVPENNILETSQTKSSPNVWFPLLIGATYLGVAFAARDETIHYAKERVPSALGQPIATLPVIQRQLGEIELALQSAKALLMQVSLEGSTPDRDTLSFLHRANSAKQFCVETALEVTDKALRLAGAAGLHKDLSLERYFRDVRAGLMHPPSKDSVLEQLGKAALGLQGS